MVDNYPGFRNGILGPDLMQEMRAQAERFGTVYISKDATKVELGSTPKAVYVENQSYLAKTVIIASGARPNLLGLPNEKRLMGKGVSSCATCDGFFFKNKDVAVVGGGDSAMEETIVMTKYASTVYLIHRRDKFRASKVMVDRILAQPKVKVIYHTIVEDFVGGPELTAIRTKNVLTNETADLALSGAFIAIGHSPNSELFKGQIDMDNQGYIITQPKSSKTSIPGVFACGDVQDHVYRQAVTAAGSGCVAAIDADHYLSRST